MGDWLTVNIRGSIPEEQVEPLRAALDRAQYEREEDARWKRWRDENVPLRERVEEDERHHRPYRPLEFNSERPGLCGLGDWPARVARGELVTGNCYERDFGPEDVADHLRALVAEAPGMRLFVDCGGAYEDPGCTATVVVGSHEVTVGPPLVETLFAISSAQMAVNMELNLRRAGLR